LIQIFVDSRAVRHKLDGMKRKSPKSASDRYKDAIERAIDSKIKRLEARAQSRPGENGDLAEKRTAAVRVNRTRAEMLLAKARGELIAKELVVKQAAYLLVALRQRILAIPQTYCRRLLNISDLKAIAAALKTMSLSMLEELRHLPARVIDPHWLESLEKDEASPG
jgi:hypothetical protein